MQIGHAGYGAAVAVGWGDGVRRKLDEWNRRYNEDAGAEYVCYACGWPTPTAALGGLVAGHERCAGCSATPGGESRTRAVAPYSEGAGRRLPREHRSTVEERGMDSKVTHIVRMDPEGTSDEERERLQADFAALLASGQPLLGGTPRVAEPVRGDARDPDEPSGLRAIVGGQSARPRRRPTEV